MIEANYEPISLPGNESTSTIYPVPDSWFENGSTVKVYADGVEINYGRIEGEGITTLTALAADASVVITRETELSQNRDFTNNGGLPSREIEGGLDKALKQIQEQGEALGRSVILPIGGSFDESSGSTFGIGPNGVPVARTVEEQLSNLGVDGALQDAVEAAQQSADSILGVEERILQNAALPRVTNLLASESLTLPSSASYSDTLFTGDEVLIEHNDVLDCELWAVEGSFQYYLADGVLGGRSFGVVEQGQRLRVTSTSVQSFVSGPTLEVSLSEVEGALAYLNSEDFDTVAGTITDTISGKVFTAATVTNYSLRLGKDASNLIALPAREDMEGDFSIEVRMRFPGGATGSNNDVSAAFWGDTSLNNYIAITDNDIRARIGNVAASLIASHDDTVFDFTNFFLFRMVRTGSTVEYFLDDVKQGEILNAPTGDFSIRDLGGVNTTPLGFAVEFDWLEVINAGQTRRLDFSEGSGDQTTDSLGGVFTSLNTITNEWQDLGQTGFSPSLVSAPAGDADFQAVDVGNVFYDNDGTPKAVEITSLGASEEDQVLTKNNQDGSYEVLILGAPSVIKSQAIAREIEGALQEVETPYIGIIAAAGQSNSNGIRWAFDPYNNIAGLNLVAFGWKGGQGGRESLPYRGQVDFEAGRINENMGSLFPVTVGLVESNYRANDIPRFASLQTGSGGRVSREWRVGDDRHQEFVDGIAALTAELNLRYPGVPVRLEHVIINQGEADGTNISMTINNLWGPSWLEFIDDISASYGEQVTFTVEALSTNDSLTSYTERASGWDIVKAQQLAIDKDSGDAANSRSNVTVIDPDIFITPELVNSFPTSGSAAVQGGYRRDGVHWGALALNWFGDRNLEFLAEKLNFTSNQ